MGNGLCPECGCVTEKEYHEVMLSEEEGDWIVETTDYCPCCQYTETTYDV